VACAHRGLCGYAEALRSGHRDDRDVNPVNDARIEQI
jgi:hypothetical protein